MYCTLPLLYADRVTHQKGSITSPDSDKAEVFLQTLNFFVNQI